MADFKNINDRIDEEITENGQGDITGLVLNSLLKAILAAVDAAKVDTESGKGLSTNDFTTALKNKLNAMPNITNYDATNDRITIGSKTYQLTEYVPIPDYYVGWTSGTKSEFAAKTAEQLVASATPYMVSSNPTYQHACTNIIFYVMFKTDKAPVSGSLNSGGLVSPITAQEFLSGGSCPHGDITYSGTTYKVYGLRNSDLIGDTNIITVNF